MLDMTGEKMKRKGKGKYSGGEKKIAKMSNVDLIPSSEPEKLAREYKTDLLETTKNSTGSNKTLMLQCIQCVI